MEIADLTLAERRVWQAFPHGEPVDFRPSEEENPEAGRTWDAERTIRAAVIRGLLLSDPPESSAAPALRLTGARISGLLDLQYAQVCHPIRLTGCYFEQPPNLHAARTSQFDLSSSYLPALRATAVHVDGALRLSGCRIPGSVELASAQVSRGIFLDGARIGAGGGCVLQLSHAAVGEDVWAPNLTALGGIRLGSAHIKGALSLEDARLENSEGDALDAARLDIGTIINAGGLTAEGRIRLTGSTVGGWISFIEARLTNPGGVALGISSCHAAQLTLRDAEPIRGDVKLHHSSFTVIEAEPQVWPDTVRLEGLRYEALTPRLPAAQRLGLLERDADGFAPHAYEQLAAYYRRIGEDAEARTVLLIRQRRHRAGLPWYGRLWGYLQDATVGYGFRPARAMGWLLALLVLGSLAYGLHQPPPAEHGAGPAFNPVIYTLDLLVPVIGFGQRTAFTPVGAYQWLSYFLIAAGWILATSVAAGITRTLNRQ